MTAVADQKKKKHSCLLSSAKTVSWVYSGGQVTWTTSSNGTVSAKNYLLSRFVFWNGKWGQFCGHTAFLAQAALKVANLSTFFSKILFCVERRVQKEGFGQVKNLLDSSRIFILHLQLLSAFLWEKCLTSLLVRFSSQLVQSVHINIYQPGRQLTEPCLLGGCVVGASMPDISLVPLSLSSGHSSDWGGAGESLVWAQSKTPVAPDKGYSTEILWWRTKPSHSCLADLCRQRDECIVTSYKTDVEFGDLGSLREGPPGFAQAAWFGCGRSGWPAACSDSCHLWHRLDKRFDL